MSIIKHQFIYLMPPERCYGSFSRVNLEGKNIGAAMFARRGTTADSQDCCRIKIYVNNNVQGVNNSVLLGSEVKMRDPGVCLYFGDIKFGRNPKHNCFYSSMNKKITNQSSLLCCKLFISESRNLSALDLIEKSVRRDTETMIVNKFEDRAYNRVRYTLVSYVVHDSTGTAIYSPLHQCVLAMVEAAYAAINLELHSGAHPRLGVVDDIVFHPLARASLDEAAWLAKAVAADVGSRFQVPVFLYGAAHPTGKALDTIRRELNYYRPNFMGNQWAGWTTAETLPVRPNEGPNQVSRARGIAMIGARPWVAFYNVPIMSTDISLARRIARMVSARGGGLPTVQALGLAHGEDSTEIACMLLEPNQVGADRVQSRVEMLAAKEGLDVKKGYFTDFSPEMIVEKYLNLISANRD
ncbi:formimidoyltransferase-cyclodeaminase-like [Pistacia vera]|uniref:formimidoyltransferase-cyclodeaminase-like n=1 Tax=Pistacia vera TaxID=55513 RepID=UPI001263CC07|nr:formimidoyltransferase-cyclodeaminase-like [Pistacia vera]